eukprot:GFUD01014682.1.p1 GENE.GFUD01014682.1~~GFUD01014682.1.p1  ORF type:complete len:670 (-),score=123.63 GFUD01014682.1:1820-3829(-)
MTDSPSGREGDSEQGPEDLRSDSKKKCAVVMTSQPTNESELQLYRVLQRANLLNYYDTFISQGGDDVQQLCEAGEEEFLEIMALVGMASKPLHVRRLQKALQEWVQNPGVFQTPLVPTLGGFPTASAAAAAAVIRASGGVMPQVSVAPSIMGGMSVPSPSMTSSLPHSVPSLVPTSVAQSLPTLLAHSRALPSHSPPLSLTQPVRPPSSHSPSPLIKDREGRLMRDRDTDGRGDRDGRIDRSLEMREDPSPPSSQSRGPLSLVAGGIDEQRLKQRPPNLSWDLSTSEDAYSGDHPGPPTSPLQLTPVLVESQIQRIADTAGALVKSLPVSDLEPKQPNAKKKICKELEIVMSMSEEDTRKMDEIRKFSAIYGRFDCKRKPEKPLTLHEVSVNEAAAQICRLVPAMLTRRDELFPLARQVVRDSGYQYSKGHSRSTFSLSSKLFNGDEGPFKRMRFSEDSEMTQRRRERMEQILDEARMITDRLDELRGAAGQARMSGDIPALQHISQQVELCQAKQAQLMQEKDEHQRIIRFSSRMSTCSDPDRPDTDDENSQRSYSNASSPSASLQAPNYDLGPSLVGSESRDRHFASEAKVLSASGGQIIAVQNPALSLSGAFPGGRGSPPSNSHPPPTSMSGLILGSRPVPSSPSRTSPNLKQEPSSPPSNHRDKE